MREFTPETLADFDGHDPDKPIYVAKDGKVYDVSESKLWKGGLHMRRHQAGHDLSADFSAAPHGTEVLERVTQIGIMAGPQSSADQRIPSWLAELLARFPILARHPHPMLVHYPIAFMFSVTGFTILALLTGNRSLEQTAFHCLGAGVLFSPLTIVTGLGTWWLNYQARPMLSVTIKLWGSIILLLVASVAFAWRWRTPTLLDTLNAASATYLFLLCALPVLVSIIGWFGAQLTFPLGSEKH